MAGKESLKNNAQDKISAAAKEALGNIFATIDNNPELSKKEQKWLETTLKKLEKKNPALVPQLEERIKTHEKLKSLETAILEAIPLNKRGKIKTLSNKPKRFYETLIAELQGENDNSLIQEEVLTESETGKNIETVTKTIINSKDRFKESDCSIGKEFNLLDFPSNHIERAVGLADLMPFTVRSVKVTDPNGNSKVAERDSIGGGFYYKPHTYAKIFSNYKFEIDSITTPQDLVQKRQIQEKNFPSSRIENIEHDESEKEILQEVAFQYGFDPLLLLALRQTENGREGREMGILSVKTADFTDQARLAARSIENSSHRFAEKYPNEKFWQSSGVISAKGLAFCSSRYCTDGSEHARLWAKMYNQNGGPSLNISDAVKASFVDNSARSLDESNYSVNTKGEISAQIERSSSGTTLCSRTTRKLLSQCAGIDRTEALSGGSAAESKQMNESVYGKLSLSLPIDNSNCLDIYLTSNSEYGHRAFGYKYRGEWIVVDPYRNAAKGVPFEEYSMRNKVTGIKAHTAKPGTIVDRTSKREA